MATDNEPDTARDPRGENESPDGFTHPVLRDPLEILSRPPLFADGRGFDAGKHLHDVTEYNDQPEAGNDLDYGVEI